MSNSSFILKSKIEISPGVRRKKIIAKNLSPLRYPGSKKKLVTYIHNYTAEAGYRLLDIRHKEDDFKLDTLMHGPIIGMKVTF